MAAARIAGRGVAATKAGALVARVDKLFALKEGPDLDRIRIGIREALLVPGAEGNWKCRAGALRAARYSMELLHIMMPEDVEADPEPEHGLYSLAVLAERLEAIIDAANAELDHAERENGSRRKAATA